MMEFTIFFIFTNQTKTNTGKKILFNNNEIENGSQDKLMVGPEKRREDN